MEKTLPIPQDPSVPSAPHAGVAMPPGLGLSGSGGQLPGHGSKGLLGLLLPWSPGGLWQSHAQALSCCFLHWTCEDAASGLRSWIWGSLWCSCLLCILTSDFNYYFTQVSAISTQGRNLGSNNYTAVITSRFYNISLHWSPRSPYKE